MGLSEFTLQDQLGFFLCDQGTQCCLDSHRVADGLARRVEIDTHCHEALVDVLLHGPLEIRLPLLIDLETVGRRADAFEHLTLDIDEEGGIEALRVQSRDLDFEVGAVGGINDKLALGLPLYILCLNQEPPPSSLQIGMGSQPKPHQPKPVLTITMNILFLIKHLL